MPLLSMSIYILGQMNPFMHFIARKINYWQSDSKDIYSKSNKNPILDSGPYEVVFQDGRVEATAASIITESMWPQCDTQGNKIFVFKSIV
jgi:hypothetical protein